MTINLTQASIKAIAANRATSTPGTAAATTRILNDRFSDVINVLDFGADPTATNDSQPAFQAAVNWQTSNATRASIYIPRGRYVIGSTVQLPNGSIHIYGDAQGTTILAGFNGFVFDQLSVPYAAGSQGVIIEKLTIQNNYPGQNTSAAASSAWIASASPVTITVPSLPTGITTNCLVYILDQQIAPMPVFVGITSSVVAGTSITMPTTAVGSSGFTTLNLAFVQCYAAAATWVGNATTITMPGSPPAGVPTNCIVYDYDRILYGDGTVPNVFLEGLGVGNWSGSTVTFTAGVSQGSHTSADRLIFAPLSGCIRISSTVVGSIRDCVLRGFVCITTDQDNVNTVGLQTSAESYSILVESSSFTCAAHAAAIGTTGLYLTNNSISLANDLSALWIGTRVSGLGNSIIAGRCEGCTYGIALQASTNTGNTVASANLFAGFTLESNTYAIVGGGGGQCQITGLNILCQNNNGQYGCYMNSGKTVFSASSIQGNWAGYAIYIVDPQNNAALNTYISVIAANNNIPQHWRIPAQAWWGTCIQCNNPQLVYTYANLPSVSTNPAAVEGDQYNISDCNTSTFLATAAGGGSTATAHRRVRWNAVSSLWQVVG